MNLQYNPYAKGALLGMAIGDALGTTLEFTSPPAPKFPELATGPHDDIIGGGPFGLVPGQVTDDTHMACCLAASLAEHKQFVVGDIALRYKEWSYQTFDIGSTIGSALRLLDEGIAPEQTGLRSWLRSGKFAAANGSLMRTAPIGVFFAGDAEARRAASLADSAITHYDPRCRLACAAFNSAIASGIANLGADSTSRKMLAAALRELDDARNSLLDENSEYTNEIDSANTDLSNDLAKSQNDDPELYGPELHILRQQGFVRVAFRLAFWELLHAPSFKAGLIDAVNRGGDADTNGAIVGALLGARWGEKAIPQSWKDKVMSALQDQKPAPLRDAYHPKVLLTAIGHLL